MTYYKVDITWSVGKILAILGSEQEWEIVIPEQNY
jgi:hypothetical protein